jgi:hypothetical protein
MPHADLATLPGDHEWLGRLHSPARARLMVTQSSGRSGPNRVVRRSTELLERDACLAAHGQQATVSQEEMAADATARSPG